ncbi:cell cycle control protein 50A [Dermacentor silvarum]|uniref:cell cycle control protein 50A n=1 Tax=Dermacentor silvarum TaxID=543639 RepID=UPI0021014B86|nr:cell cycle control protein 50A [Dermacentor silvarum]
MASPQQRSHKPIDRPFWQQKLPGWTPMLNAGNAALPFLLVGFIFVPIGVAVFLTTSRLQEYQFDYTECRQVNTNKTCASVIAKEPTKSCVCYEIITLPEDFRQTVNVYYALTSFYQNFRFYVQSRDEKQLLGFPHSARMACKPYDVDPKTGYTIFPCGAIANSLFNDTFKLRYRTGSNYRDVEVSTDNISWPSDRERKFRNPINRNLSGTVKPPNWPLPVDQLPGGLQNEAFMVWMRTAALPSLRKLYGRIASTGDFARVMPRGEYYLEVHYPADPVQLVVDGLPQPVHRDRLRLRRVPVRRARPRVHRHQPQIRQHQVPDARDLGLLRETARVASAQAVASAAAPDPLGQHGRTAAEQDEPPLTTTRLPGSAPGVSAMRCRVYAGSLGPTRCTGLP